MAYSWDRDKNNKGALFEVGKGLVGIRYKPNGDENINLGLDFRTSQGVFMCIQVWEYQ